ncbi:MFS transporter [Tessaracoccus sp. MC1627]|uniref:MFS transporter n=1 Tax=Tessaracoccus sp. MC1627 TaxID=2760312 RepID=UPI0015FF464F|nr:MFS transporter [Tessaracoccus sp. MC1627]MBB1512922.1 MFS transporter [Tessaracoccus sp. MC1627]
MTGAARRVQRTYLTLTLLTTLSASFIWGVNTLLLLDAGLDNTQAFLANAAFTLGMVIFEIPTGVFADTRGRRVSFLLGAVTLLASTGAYFVMWQVRAPLLGWVVASMLIGLGSTFFSGATEAWLVDALGAAGMTEGLDAVFGRAQAVSGVGMLAGSVLGGVLAQATDLGAPYLARAALLGVTLVVAWVAMRDVGFTPDAAARPLAAVRAVLVGSVDGGLRNPPVRWLMLAAVFTSGTGLYVFYALQPFLLELAGDPGAYSIAGLAAALVAAGQIAGGLLAGPARRWIRYPWNALVLGAVANVALLVGIGLVRSLVPAMALVAGWALVTGLTVPIRQSLVNGLIPSGQRATVLSFDSLMGSAGGVVAQPALGRVADMAGYPASYLVSAAIAAGAIPFTLLARRSASR